MIRIGDKELRNLQEQVLKNKEDIARHWAVDRVLADFGIKMLGRFDSYDDIKNFDEGENYGNAYLIGTVEPYDVYVWTRADENAGQPVPYWLDIGPISLVGPQGPEGPQGIQGLQGESSEWYSGTLLPDVSTVNVGDLFLNSNTGDVYQVVEVPLLNSKQWILVINIRGPQGQQGIQGPKGEPGSMGPQGPKGEPGDVGGLLDIYGAFTSSDLLPSPTELNNLKAAYLVGTAAPYDLWIQVGETIADATWKNVGPFNAATLVQSGGVYQNLWNADTKADEWDGVGSYLTFRGRLTTQNGTQTVYSAAYTQPTASAIAMYDGNARLKTAVPAAASDCVNKQFVDGNLLYKRTTATTYDQAYVKKADGTQDVISIYNQAEPGTIPRRDGSGNFYVSSPELSNHCATKGYVDRTFIGKSSEVTTYPQVYMKAADGTQTLYNVANPLIKNSIPLRDDSYNFYVAEPTNALHCTNKKYVDDNFVAKLTAAEISGTSRVQGVNYDGTARNWVISSSIVNGSAVARDSAGTFSVSEPTQSTHVATRNYVDTEIAKLKAQLNIQ